MLLLFNSQLAVLTGTTLNSGGSPLGSCTVYAFNSATKQLVGTTTSDAVTGVYSFFLARGVNYFMVAYKVGSPDVSGTTVNTLTP